MVTTTVRRAGDGTGRLNVSPLRRRGVGVLVGPRAAGLPSAPARGGGATPSTGAQHEDLRERAPGETAARALLEALPVSVPSPGRWARLVGRDPLAPVNRAHHQQVLAERRVGHLLEDLGPRWRVLHCLPVAAGSTAHHLLVGTGGVVLVRTCAHPGEVVSVLGETVLATGRPSVELQAARAQAAVVADRLGRARGVHVPVHALVVVTGTRRLHVQGVPRGTTVLRDVDLLRWLRGRPTVLSSVEVQRLAAEAARPTTWPGYPSEVPTVRAGSGSEAREQRERRGRRRHERLRLDGWSAAVAGAARARRLARLALLGGACAAAPVVVAVLGGA